MARNIHYVVGRGESLMSHFDLSHPVDDLASQRQKLSAVGALAGGIAHEFNNLLQAILGYTTCALEGLPPDDRRSEDLQQVMRAASRAAQLTRQLLRFSRREGLQKTAVAPNMMVSELAALMRPLLGERLELRIDLAENLGALHADPCLIEQVLMNLLVNARDAMPEGGLISISTRAVTYDGDASRPPFSGNPGDYVLFEVLDTGEGMTPEVLEHVFEPFFTTKEVGKGTGLGLATAYGIVQQHNGMIYAESSRGSGTTFRVYLPLSSEGAQSRGAQRPAAATTILVAEDEPIVRELAVRVLENAGYKTLSAADGQEAVEAVSDDDGRISLVMLDLVMPRMTGREVYQRIKELRPALPILCCTGYDPESRGIDCVDHAHVELLEKPFRPDELLGVVRRMLDQSHPAPVLLTVA